MTEVNTEERSERRRRVDPPTAALSLDEAHPVATQIPRHGLAGLLINRLFFILFVLVRHFHTRDWLSAHVGMLLF